MVRMHGVASAATAFLFVAGTALAQSDAQRLECARKEGEVMVYHSTQTEDLRPVFEASRGSTAWR